jgi:hypothetical protein
MAMPARHIEMYRWYFRLQLEHPSSEEHYLMQIAAEVRKSTRKNPNSVRLTDLKLKFEPAKLSRKFTKEQIEFSKQAWFAGAAK